jgi:hypothetical protein
MQFSKLLESAIQELHLQNASQVFSRDHGDLTACIPSKTVAIVECRPNVFRALDFSIQVGN